jgi:dTDP-4-dehydrorhamnose reductase
MRIVVTGAGGMLGRELITAARARGWTPVALAHEDLDIAEDSAVAPRLAALRPEAVVNAAAYTAVDRAESEPELAMRANRDGPRVLAAACHALGIPLVHVSTDYVFDGTSSRPYVPSDVVGPLSVYGLSKWEGEEAVRMTTQRHLIVRTSWAFTSHGRNFVTTVLRLAREREELRMVDNQRGSPTCIRDLASALLVALERAEPESGLWGTYHFANAGETTWFRFASAILDDAQTRGWAPSRRIVPIGVADYPTPARRPAYSVLDTESFTRAFGVTPRPWEDALHDTLAEVAA